MGRRIQGINGSDRKAGHLQGVLSREHQATGQSQKKAGEAGEVRRQRSPGETELGRQTAWFEAAALAPETLAENIPQGELGAGRAFQPRITTSCSSREKIMKAAASPRPLLVKHVASGETISYLNGESIEVVEHDVVGFR